MGRPNRMHVCRAEPAAFPWLKSGGVVTLCAGSGGGDHRIAPPSLDVGFSSDELTPCSASKGPLCFPLTLMDGSRRAASADGRSFPSFVM